MSRSTQKMMAAAAAIGLVLTPVAAQANTRAGDNAGLYTGSQVQPGIGRAVGGENVSGTGDILAWFLVALWTAGIIVIAVDDDDDIDVDDVASPGAS